MVQAIYVVEFRSISYGIAVLDRMVKRSSLALLYAKPVCIGRYMVCVGGDVADVLEAQAVCEREQKNLWGSHLLTSAHPVILQYFTSGSPKPPKEHPPAIGVFETRGAAGGFVSLDAALKSAQVTLLRVWLGQFLGGKYCYVLSGTTSDIHAALKAAQAAISKEEFVGSEAIPSPDGITLGLFLKG